MDARAISGLKRLALFTLIAVLTVTFLQLVAPLGAYADVMRYEQNDADVAYVGTWSSLARPFHSGGTYICANKSGAKAVVRFTGTEVRLITNKDNLYGIATVALDGGAPVDVDMYSELRNVAQTNVYSRSGLAAGQHTLVIAWTGRKNPASTGTWIGLDAVEVDDGLTSANMSVTPSANVGGTISPSAVQYTAYGTAGPTFLMSASYGAHLQDVLVNGASVGAVSSYTFGTLTSPQTIEAVYAPNTYGIQASAGANGSISDAGTTQVTHGQDKTYTFTPEAYHHVADVRVDGVSVGSPSSYTFEGVTGTHTIAVTFAIDSYNISATASYNGSISPNDSGGTQFPRGTTRTYTFTPDPGYVVGRLIVDGEDVTPTSSWTFSNITQGHTLSVWFSENPVKYYEQTDDLIHYAGLWNTVPRIFHSAGSYKHTLEAGARATIRFSGTGIDYVTNKDNIYGIVRVQLDGGKAQEFDLYSAVRNVAQTTVFSASGLAAGEHVLTIEATGRRNPASGGTFIGIDRIAVRGELLSPYVTLTPSVTGVGSIYPDTAQEALAGTDGPTFLMSPGAGNHLDDVLVDGVSVGAVSSYQFDRLASSHTIEAVFAPNSYTISASAGENGSISSAGDSAVAHGGSKTYTFTPATGYHVSDVTVDGVSVGAQDDYTFSNVTVGHTIAVAFELDSYSINSFAGDHGTISPSGTTNVDRGADQSYTITPAAGYHIEDVAVDGFSVGAVSVYDFENVTEGHTIEATFAINTYTISASSGANGSITSEGDSVVDHGGSKTYTFTPATGYHVSDVTIDGMSVGAQNGYTFSNVTAGHTIEVAFAINTYTITASAGAGGSVTPSGDTSVSHGDNQSYLITPSIGYHITGVTVDGVSVGTPPSYDFENVTTGHTITATFAINTYTITATAGANGSITPVGSSVVNHGGSKTYTFKPDTGYFIADVIVNGESYGYLPNFTFTNVTTDSTIEVVFGLTGGRYEQTDPFLYYEGSWNTVTRTFHSAGSYKATTTTGARVTAKFIGSAVTYVTNKDYLYGIVKVTLDGGEPAYVDLYSATRNIAQGRVWTAEGLSYAEHTLVIEYVGLKNPAASARYIGIDALDITGELINANP